MFLNDHLALGVEYRHKPNNLSVFWKDDCRDIFLAWIPHRRAPLTLAYAQLDNVANQPDQEAVYDSVQLS